MIYTKSIPHPSGSHSVEVTFRCEEIVEETYAASVCVEILSVDKEYTEEGELVEVDWIDCDYVNGLML